MLPDTPTFAPTHIPASYSEECMAWPTVWPDSPHLCKGINVLKHFCKSRLKNWRR